MKKHIDSYLLIKQSKYFDSDYYVKDRPDVLDAGVDPVLHYLVYGYKEGANPSSLFCNDLYLECHKTCKINPLVHYILHGCKEDWSLYGYIDNNLDVINYTKYRATRKTDTVCYTYVSKNYDGLIQHRYVNKEWDYVCFTNNKFLLKQKQIGIWTIKKSKCERYDSKRNSGWHKTHPHKLFPKYAKSLWIDANINIRTDYLEKIIKQTNKLMLVPIHFERDCVYKELEIIKVLKKDSIKACNKTTNFLLKNKMPKNYGLNETGIMYRKHNNRAIKSVDNLWWKCIRKYSKRDQATFSYCLWKHNINVEDISIPSLRIDKKIFYIGNHSSFDTKYERVYKKIPMWLGRLICCFIPKQKNRHNFREKYISDDIKTSFYYKEKCSNGRIHIYICGIKIMSFLSKNKDDLLLVYTCADKKYFPFAILYPLFCIYSNKNSRVEIGILGWKEFVLHYGNLIRYYEKNYSGKVFFHPVNNIASAVINSVRFVTYPVLKAKYIYIGDVDIMITDDICKHHLQNIKKYKLDFSNIKRKGLEQLSGLHFMEYDKYYPIKIPKGIDLTIINDEVLLYKMMASKGYNIPDENKCTYRPLLGVHFSFFSRPPLPTLTTRDKKVTCFPSWFANTSPTQLDYIHAKKYLKIRYKKEIANFMRQIDPINIELRKIIQYMDMSCWYFLKNRF